MFLTPKTQYGWCGSQLNDLAKTRWAFRFKNCAVRLLCCIVSGNPAKTLEMLVHGTPCNTSSVYTCSPWQVVAHSHYWYGTVFFVDHSTCPRPPNVLQVVHLKSHLWRTALYLLQIHAENFMLFSSISSSFSLLIWIILWLMYLPPEYSMFSDLLEWEVFLNTVGIYTTFNRSCLEDPDISSQFPCN